MNANIKGLIGVVVVLVLVGALVTTALIPLFNSSSFVDVYNSTGDVSGSTGIGAWVPTTLGIIGVVAFIFVILRVAGKR